MKAVVSPSRPIPAKVFATDPPGTSRDASRPASRAAISTSARAWSISCMMPFCTPSAARLASSAGPITSMTALPMPMT